MILGGRKYHQNNENHNESFLHPNTAHVKVDTSHDLILWRAWRRHAATYDLYHERYKVESDEYERKGRSLNAEEAVGGDVVPDQPCEDHVDECVHPYLLVRL